MAPRSIFYHISFRSTILQSFTFRSINQKYQKYLLYRLAISIRSHFCKWTWRDWQPLYRVGCKFVWLFVQVFSDLCIVSYWIDTLVLKLREILISTLLHHPFLFKGKTNASSRSSRKNFWRRRRGDLHQVKTYQVPIINSHLLHYIICHSPLVFLSPTSKTILEKICLFFALLSFDLLFACVTMCLPFACIFAC